jgi:hypothetical protein
MTKLNYDQEITWDTLIHQHDTFLSSSQTFQSFTCYNATDTHIPRVKKKKNHLKNKNREKKVEKSAAVASHS